MRVKCLTGSPPSSVPLTCLPHLFPLTCPPYFTRSPHLFPLPVPLTCPPCLSPPPVPLTCPPHLSPLPVPLTRPPHLSPLPVPLTCPPPPPPNGSSPVSRYVLRSFMVSLCLCWFLLVSTGRVSKNDCVEWLCQLEVELLKESPSPTLCSCWALAQVYKSLPQ